MSRGTKIVPVDAALASSNATVDLNALPSLNSPIMGNVQPAISSEAMGIGIDPVPVPALPFTDTNTPSGNAAAPNNAPSQGDPVRDKGFVDRAKETVMKNATLNYVLENAPIVGAGFREVKRSLNKGHTEAISCLSVNKDRMFSASIDGMVKGWTHECGSNDWTVLTPNDGGNEGGNEVSAMTATNSVVIVGSSKGHLTLYPAEAADTDPVALFQVINSCLLSCWCPSTIHIPQPMLLTPPQTSAEVENTSWVCF